MREQSGYRLKRGFDIMKRYQRTINEILMMEKPESFVYFSDPETYEILYISDETFISEELRREQYRGCLLYTSYI